jgi:1,4-alpha-glucan branching enzyme
MQIPLVLLFALLAVAVGPYVHPAWGRSRDGRDWSRETARPVPDWVKDAVVYEVFPRVFSPEGNLAGVTARLDHVRDLGATVVWLMPIHPIGLEKRKGTYGSPYSIRDFHAVNPDYGSPEDLKHLVREAHARGLRVILDVVANHTPGTT